VFQLTKPDKIEKRGSNSGRWLGATCAESTLSSTANYGSYRIQRDPGINETRPRTITRHEGQKSVTGSDKLPLDLWRRPREPVAVVWGTICDSRMRETPGVNTRGWWKKKNQIVAAQQHSPNETSTEILLLI